MCGITGFAGFTDRELLGRMNDAMIHRGPDDSGYFSDDSARVSFAMRRLAVIDLETGKQPLSNEDESVWVVANGEIFNAPELRERLISGGHRFRTRNSDVEVLLHLYEDTGPDFLHEINGMFAFVIYDKRKKLLFGCRDRIGIKPFYYALKDGKLAFASEIRPLLLLPWISRQIDFNSLYHYVSMQFVPAPRSIFCDIKKLEAGHFFIYDLASRALLIKQYWDLDVNKAQNRSRDEWREMLRARLSESVKRWTLSDVPIACSLSGGIDSSALVGLLAQSGYGDLRTYSLGFSERNERQYNELPLAAKVASRWSTKHSEFVLDSSKVLDDLNRMVRYLDEPYGGGLPSWYIFEMISRDVKVCLTGTGGDELFGNYGKWVFHENRILKYMKAAHSFSRFFYLKEILDYKKYPAGHYYWRYFSDAVKDDLVFSAMPAAVDKTEAFIESIWKRSGSTNARDAVAYVDFKLQLPEEHLYITDRFSMAHSVEARVPLLDHTLVEMVYHIPYNIRTRFTDQKYLFKEAVKDLIPQELMGAPKKGFRLPLNVWTTGALKPALEELLSPDYLSQQGIFSRDLYYRIVRPHIRGMIEATPQVWILFMFQLWYREYCS
ncbi:MAG: asparagine synthase (glutamine-hydrolyzing) [Candidatus Omnitrophica bacterium]|nr:asparagine synthase (glutamine-hydrolyzing) [Candidatus Omnitrophota bacterium]